ncbi:MAG: FAD-dependent oxidoreductase [Bacteroidales bacterium]
MEKTNIHTAVQEMSCSLEQFRLLTPSTFVLRFKRNQLKFQAGQHLLLGLPGSQEAREYSIYSGESDNAVEVLIKEIDEGLVSRQLKSLESGGNLRVKGPYGFFLKNADRTGDRPLLFLASGTGIAPFHSFIRSHPRADYRLFHGVRTRDEAYEAHEYAPERLTVCTSRDKSGDFSGRLTDCLKTAPLDPRTHVFLCGNSDMIYDAMDVLHARGLSQNQIFTEVYF